MDKQKLLNKIDQYLLEKDYVSARKLIRNDLKRIGSKYQYYLYMGVASTETSERMNYFRKAYTIEPDNIEIIVNLANVKDETGDYDKAIYYYTKAIESDSTNPLIYNNRGYSYFHKKDYENALADYNQALLLSPKFKIAQDNRKVLINKLKSKPEYAEFVEKAEKEFYNYKYYFHLGINEMENSNSNEAMTAFNKSVELNPDFAPVYMYIGILELNKGNYTNAFDYYTKSINRDASIIDAYFNRAQIVFATKTEDILLLKSAIADLDKAVELDPKFIEAYYSRAVIYKNIKEYEKALESLEKILEIDEQAVNAKALKKLIETKYLNKV